MSQAPSLTWTLQGILEYGTRVFMERQGNYFLSVLGAGLLVASDDHAGPMRKDSIR